MSLGLLTSSLRVLKTLKSSTTEHSDQLLNIINDRLVHKGQEGYEPPQRRSRLQLILLSCAVCGIEFCYAAETAFVSPTLLKIGVHVIYMSLIWCLSPTLGFILVPILGSMSDRCQSRLGRRRPFILVLSVTIILGLIFVPNGQTIGRALGDDYSEDDKLAAMYAKPTDIPYGTTQSFLGDTTELTTSDSILNPLLRNLQPLPSDQNATNNSSDVFNPFSRYFDRVVVTGDYSLELVEITSNPEDDVTETTTLTPRTISLYEISPHPWSILFTVLGVVMLDFSCDACQSPCRAYLLDVSAPEDHQAGLATFTVMAGLGGSLGYVLGGINWEHTSFGESLGGHVRVVFTLVLIIYIVCLGLTITAVKEVPLPLLGFRKEDLQQDEKRKDGSKYTKFKNEETEDRGLVGNNQAQVADYGSGKMQQGIELTHHESSNPYNPFRKQEDQNHTVDNKPPPAPPTLSVTPADSPHNIGAVPQLDSPPSPSGPLPSDISLGTYLMSIVDMPKSLFILCLTNLWCWMSLVCYSLYFTDFVGQAVYGGDPLAPPGSAEHQQYEDGVRAGSLAMSLYSLSCSMYSLSIEKLVEKLGAKPVYIGSQLVYTAGAMMMAISQHKITIVLLSPCAGIMYATLFTMPYLLVAHYHANNTFHEDEEKELTIKEAAKKQIRGLGTDIALVSSMVFIAQFVLSAVMGSIVHAMGSTVAVPICASVLSFIGALTATQVLYLGL